ncbi:hypothetical protein AMTRI_Chr05g62630 [Amborella trichopoda]
MRERENEVASPRRMNTQSSSKALNLWNRRNQMDNQTLEDSIIIPYDSEEVVPPERREPRESPIPILSSNSWQVIDPLDWRTHGGLIMEQVRLPFPDKVKRLNRCSYDIRTIEMGPYLLRTTYQLFGHASFFEFSMFPFFVKKLMKNLTDFHIPGASLFKGNMEAITQWAREVMEIEDPVSIEKNPSSTLAKTPFEVTTHTKPCRDIFG